MSALSLWQLESPTPLKLTRGFTPRDFQAEDVDAIEAAWKDGNLHVLCVWSTGLGKSVGAAELAARKPDGARAMIIVDSTDLAQDLYRTVMKHVGRRPGILTGDFKAEWGYNEIVIATKQCLCAGKKGEERYRLLDMSKVDRLIVDECEAALADEYATMMVHFIEQNPELKIVGLTATPLPSANRNIGDLFSHAASEPGPLYRDLQWAYLNGWLVQPRQGVLRCSMDFSSLKVRKNESGEKDYSDKDIAKLMMEQDEREWIELGNGIYDIAKGHTAIVVCPNSTEVADKLASYIEGAAREDGKRDVAHSIHRSLGKKRSADMMARFKAGEFPIAVSVKMFEKGFDFDEVNTVIVVRRTKSLRLYTQITGRGTRPLTEIREALANAKDAAERMNIIKQSRKPSMVVVDCVGINDQAKDILGVIDILGRGVPQNIRERVRQMAIDRANNKPDDDEDNLEDKSSGTDVGDDARAAIRQMRDEAERERRARISARVQTHLEIQNGRRSMSVPAAHGMKPKGDATPKQVNLLVAFGVDPNTAQSYRKRQAGAVIEKYKRQNTVPDWKLVRRWERQQQGAA